MTDYVHRISEEERERIRRFVRTGAVITVLFVAVERGRWRRICSMISVAEVDAVVV